MSRRKRRFGLGGRKRRGRRSSSYGSRDDLFHFEVLLNALERVSGLKEKRDHHREILEGPPRRSNIIIDRKRMGGARVLQDTTNVPNEQRMMAASIRLKARSLATSRKEYFLMRLSSTSRLLAIY